MSLNHPIGSVKQLGQRRIGRGEQVIVDLQFARVVEELRGEIRRRAEWHMALIAVGFGLGRIIKTRDPVPRDPAEQERIVVVLTPQPFVRVEFRGQMHLVTRSAELGRLVQRFEKRLLVKGGFGLDELAVEPGQQWVLAEGEGIVGRFLDRVVGVAARAVDVRDRMAACAGNTGLRRCIRGQIVVRVVEFRVVEGPAEERHRIVTTRTEPRAPHVTVAFEDRLSRPQHAEKIRRVVERAEAMGAVFPPRVDVGMAFEAIAVVVQDAGRDESAGRGPGQRRKEVLLAGRGAHAVLSRIARVQPCHGQGKGAGDRAPYQTNTPADASTGQPVKDEQPHRDQWRDHVRPVDDSTHFRIAQLETQPEHVESDQDQAADQQQQTRGEQRVAGADRPSVRPVSGVANVQHAEDHHRQDQDPTQYEVQQEHELVEIILINLATNRFEEGNAGQVDRVDAHQGDESEDDGKELFQARPDRRHVPDAGGVTRISGDGVGRGHANSLVGVPGRDRTLENGRHLAFCAPLIIPWRVPWANLFARVEPRRITGKRRLPRPPNSSFLP